MKNQTKTFTKKTVIVFTTITISKSFPTPINPFRYMAEFKSGDSKDNLKSQLITGFNLQNVIKECSSFLDCEIDERHYIIK